METPALPLWLSTLLLAAALIIATEIGFRMARFLRGRRKSRREGDADATGYLLSGALALLGLLIGFTYSQAAGRYDARRAWVNEEANAIGTAYLRSRLIDPAGPSLPGLWTRYAEVRQGLVEVGRDPARLKAGLAESDRLQAVIWRQTESVARATPNDVTAAVVEATNEAFDVAASRLTAAESRVPPGIIWSIVIYAVAVSAILGTALAADQRRLLMSSSLLTLLAFSIGLIVDLDRPGVGLVRVSQSPINRVVETIHSLEQAPPPLPAPE